MATQRGPVEPFKRLLPQSWFGWLAAVLLAVVSVTHPSETWHAGSRTVWGAGRWIGYEAFGHCDDPPPFTWMSPKHCPPPPGTDQPDPTVTATATTSGTSGIIPPTPPWLQRLVDESKATADEMTRRRTADEVLSTTRKRARR